MNRFQHAESFGIRAERVERAMKNFKKKAKKGPSRKAIPNKTQSKKLDARVRAWQASPKQGRTCPGSLNSRKQA